MASALRRGMTRALFTPRATTLLEVSPAGTAGMPVRRSPSGVFRARATSELGMWTSGLGSRLLAASSPLSRRMIAVSEAKRSVTTSRMWSSWRLRSSSVRTRWWKAWAMRNRAFSWRSARSMSRSEA